MLKIKIKNIFVHLYKCNGSWVLWVENGIQILDNNVDYSRNIYIVAGITIILVIQKHNYLQ